MAGLDKLIKEKMTQKLTTQEWVTEILREAILNNYIDEEGLDTTTLAKRLGVSRMPVRAALYQLEYEGLVILEPHKKAVATKLSPEEVKQIYVVRYELEALAIKLAIKEITDSDLVELYDLVIRMDFCNEKEFVSLNKHFHNKINELSKNEDLYHLNNKLRNNVDRYLKLFVTEPANMKLANKEHKEIVTALKDRDVERGTELMKAHLNHTCERVIKQLYHYGYKQVDRKEGERTGRG